MDPSIKAALERSRQYTIDNVLPDGPADERVALLLVRCPPAFANALAANPHLSGNRFVALGQQSIDSVNHRAFEAVIEDRPHYDEPARTAALVTQIIQGFRVREIVIAQPSFWYSTVVAAVAQRFDVPVIWLEQAFNGRAYLDRIGAVYTPENEIGTYVPQHEPRPIPPLRTRLDQPPSRSAYEVRAQYGPGIVVFGQVPYDMAVLQYPGLSYDDWLHELFTQNPDTPFLFKHHPLASTVFRQWYPNVRMLDESVETLLAAYEYFASFSSSTIAECVAAGRKVVTGGYHALRHSGCTLDDAIDRLAWRLKWDFVPDPEAIEHWLSFLYHEYSVDLNSQQAAQRLLWRSPQYFRG